MLTNKNQRELGALAKEANKIKKENLEPVHFKTDSVHAKQIKVWCFPLLMGSSAFLREPALVEPLPKKRLLPNK